MEQIRALSASERARLRQYCRRGLLRYALRRVLPHLFRAWQRAADEQREFRILLASWRYAAWERASRRRDHAFQCQVAWLLGRPPPPTPPPSP